MNKIEINHKKSKKSNIKNIIIVILLVFNVLLIYQVSIYKIDANSHSSFTHAPMEYNLRLSYEVNVKKIIDLVLYDIYNRKKQLASLLKGRRSLLILYFEESCNICATMVFKECNSLWSERKHNTTVLCISENTSYDKLRRLAKANNIKYELYSIRDKQISDEFNIKSSPALLLLNENMEIENSFFVSPSTREYTKLFIQNASKYFAGKI